MKFSFNLLAFDHDPTVDVLTVLISSEANGLVFTGTVPCPTCEDPEPNGVRYEALDSDGIDSIPTPKLQKIVCESLRQLMQYHWDNQHEIEDDGYGLWLMPTVQHYLEKKASDLQVEIDA